MDFVPFQVEHLKLILDEKIVSAGVTLYLYSKVYDVIKKDGKITKVKVAGPEGNFEIEGTTFIDASGDGMLSLYCGEDFEVGNEKAKPRRRQWLPIMRMLTIRG